MCTSDPRRLWSLTTLCTDSAIIIMMPPRVVRKVQSKKHNVLYKIKTPLSIFSPDYEGIWSNDRQTKDGSVAFLMACDTSLSELICLPSLFTHIQSASWLKWNAGSCRDRVHVIEKWFYLYCDDAQSTRVVLFKRWTAMFSTVETFWSTLPGGYEATLRV